MFSKKVIIAMLLFCIITPNKCKVIDPKHDECLQLSSCSSCITKQSCSWCVTKSKCTSNSCGNDNIIFPENQRALMSGPQFCPRIVKPEETLTIKSGVQEVIAVKITQIHLYMAFTPWKCKITVEGMKPRTVIAVLVGDRVYCESVHFESKEPYASGSVSVIWDYTKTFDGTLPFKVCRCDLDPTCSACHK